ncbi:hypothetical protein [Streptomyces sp.]|uniref:phage terminase small subunit n=1 Tax=Streptomyces sp. TaxID=1931 RepID=UPI002F92DA23
MLAEPADEPQAHGPDLPEGIEWPAPTVAWWETWRTSPQAASLTATDWDFLTDTALLHARFWAGDAKVAAELRLRVAKFGATPEDRMRLRMQVGEPPKPAAVDAGEPRTPGGSRYAHLRVAK